MFGTASPAASGPVLGEVVPKGIPNSFSGGPLSRTILGGHDLLPPGSTRPLPTLPPVGPSRHDARGRWSGRWRRGGGAAHHGPGLRRRMVDERGDKAWELEVRGLRRSSRRIQA
jgi:hypothetical protein